MSELVDVEALRVQLRLAPDVTSEDDLLQRLLDAAHGGCAHWLDRELVDLTDDEEAVAAQAIVVWATAMYEDRAGGDGVPAAVVALLRPLRSLAR